MMHVYIGLIFILLAKVKQGYTANCGSLEFEHDTVTEGGFAKLIYTPYNIHAPRRWYKELPFELNLLYTTNNKNKYVEAEQGGTLTLSILGVVESDAGVYIVSCGQGYSDRTVLTVTPPSTRDSQLDCGELRLIANNLTEGQTATLEFIIRLGRAIKWEKKINSTFQQLFKGSDYDIVKNSGNTIHNLLIYRSKYTDSGEYRVNCGTATVSNSVHLNLVPTVPSVPAFSDVADIHDCKGCILANLNEPVKVECFVMGGSEPVELNMYKDGNSISNVNNASTRRNGVKLHIAKYNFIPTTADVSVVFTCTVNNPALTADLTKSAPIYVRIDPETVVIKVQQAKENEPSEIQCITTKGRPPTKSLIYIENIKENKTEKTNEIKTYHTYNVTTTAVKQFTRFDNQIKAICCSKILNRMCSKTTTVNVLFPPKKVSVIEMMKNNEDNGDTEVKLKCSVEESNPKSSVEWKGIKDIPRTLTYSTYTDHTKTHGWTFSMIWVFNLTKDDNGRSMRCEVKNPEFPTLELVQLYRPNITYAPVITMSVQDNEVAYIGDDVLFTCHVDSNPPSSLTWHNRTNLIRKSDGTKSLDLLLHNISLNHSQIYTCTAQNNIGGIKTRSVSLLVKEKALPKAVSGSSSVSVVVPVVACAIVVAAAVTAIIVFVTCRKKRQNSNVGVKGTDQMQKEEKTADPGRNDTHNANKESSRAEDKVNEQREYESVEPNETNEYSETNYYDNVIGNLNTESGVNVRGKLYQQQDSCNATKSVLRAQNESTSDNLTPYVNLNVQEYESVTPTNVREETHTYSKLFGHDRNTHLNTGSGTKFVRGKLDQKQDSGNTTKSLSGPQNEPTSANVTLYVNMNVQEYERVTPTAEREETHTYSKLGGGDGNTN